MRAALSSVEPIKRSVKPDNAVLKRFAEQLNPCTTIRDRIERVSKNPPILFNKGNVIAEGVNDELTTCATLLILVRIIYCKYTARSEATSIPSLKITITMFGYYMKRNTQRQSA